MTDAETLNCWRINYCLDRDPHDLHAFWADRAPSGAVLALKAAVRMVERDEALLKQALEALEESTSCVDSYYVPRGKTMLASTEAAITAMRERLGEQA